MFKFVHRTKFFRPTKFFQNYSTKNTEKQLNLLGKTVTEASKEISKFRSNEFPIESEEIKFSNVLMQKLEFINDKIEITQDEMSEALNKELGRIIFDMVKIYQSFTSTTLKNRFMNIYSILKELHTKNIVLLNTQIYNEILEVFVSFKDKTNFNLTIVDMKQYDIEINSDTFKAMIKISIIYKEYEKVTKIVDVMQKMDLEIDDEITQLLMHEDNPILQFKKNNNF